MKNEPAFPCQEILPNGMANLTPQRGMTLRDHFAGLAMQGFLSYAATTGKYAPPDDELAREAYKMADAMFKERAK